MNPEPNAEPDAGILKALTAAPRAHATLVALPPLHRNDYLTWIGEAKKPATRARRITGMIERLGKA